MKAEWLPIAHGRPGYRDLMDTDYERVLSEAEAMLDEVDAALIRLADGSYGACRICGERIADDRLAGLPTAGTCGQHPG
jgi:RNA polymerase-binding transcription factor DksA